MPKNKKYTIYKFKPEVVEVQVGDVWMVQIEPITLGSPVLKKEILEVTDITIVLKGVNGRISGIPTRYPHYSVRFLEKVKT